MHITTVGMHLAHRVIVKDMKEFTMRRNTKYVTTVAKPSINTAIVKDIKVLIG